MTIFMLIIIYNVYLKYSGSFTSLDRMFWFRALMACMSSSERAKFSISRFSAKWLGLARGMVIKSRCTIHRSTICEDVF